MSSVVTLLPAVLPMVDLNRHEYSAQEAGHETGPAPFEPEADAVAEQDGQYHDGYYDKDDDVGAETFHLSSFRTRVFGTCAPALAPLVQ
jgi:hypothetical protein